MYRHLVQLGPPADAHQPFPKGPRIHSLGDAHDALDDQLTTPRAGHQATLLCDGTVLISGGTTTQAVIERYNPPVAGRR